VNSSPYFFSFLLIFLSNKQGEEILMQKSRVRPEGVDDLRRVEAVDSYAQNIKALPTPSELLGTNAQNI
jgi:hypothetical protein